MEGMNYFNKSNNYISKTNSSQGSPERTKSPRGISLYLEYLYSGRCLRSLINHFIESLKSSEIVDMLEIKRGKGGIFQTNKNYLKFEKDIFVCIRNNTIYTHEEFLDALLKIYENKYIKEIGLEGIFK